MLNGFRKKSSIKAVKADGNELEQSLRPSDVASSQERDSSRLRPRTAGSSRQPPSLRGGQDDDTDASSHAEVTRPRRLSLKRFRYSSDPQLSYRYKEHDHEPEPPSPAAAPAPVIGITAPSWDELTPYHKPKKSFRPFSSRKKSYLSTSGSNYSPSEGAPDENTLRGRAHSAEPRTTERSPRPSTTAYSGAPPPYGDETRSIPAVPVTGRPSESSASDGTSGDRIYGATTTTHTISTTTTFFKLPRRKKKKIPDSLFPLPVKLSPPTPVNDSESGATPSPAKSVARSQKSQLSQGSESPPRASSIDIESRRNTLRPSAAAAAPVSNSASSVPSLGHPGRSEAFKRHDSSASKASAQSSPSMVPFARKQSRGRSTTMSSGKGRLEDERPSLPESGRNSTASTTVGRNSIAGLRSLTSRLRTTADSQSPRHSSPRGTLQGSNNNSFAISRETLVVPEREEGETSGKYYSRLEKDLPKKSIAMVFAKSADPFSHDVLRSLMRTFKFYEEPMDIALRRFLWEIDLPGEAQQIDRVMSAFAERYHECNPHIFTDFDEAYLAAYSLIILHSDLFNKNNKRKMQRSEYQKNTGGQGIDQEILGYFYDNIQYTEFIAQNPDDDDSVAPKSTKLKTKRTKSLVPSPEPTKQSKRDPYEFIIDDKLKLDILRPSLKDLNIDDTYNYLGSAERIDIAKTRTAFFRCGVIQLVSARSRPDAFTSPSTINNPSEAHPGVVKIKVAKVGVLWRKEAKRKKTRSPWQEWGAVLTSSQLYFFRNVSWVKSLVGQLESHRKHGNKLAPVHFKPEIEEFRADFTMRIHHAIALQDTSYKRHKYAFLLAHGDDRHEEVVLAEDENDMNDWLAKINYASAFTTSGIALEPLPLPNFGLLRPRRLSRVDERSASPGDTARGNNDENQVAEQLLANRKRIISNKVIDSEESMSEAKKRLEENLKTLRHLQILAPFTQKTRSDLLAYGARMALKVRWARFDSWRLKAQKEILLKELEENENPDPEVEETDMSRALSPLVSSGKLRALSRLNSKASAFISPQKAAKSGRGSPYLTASSGPPQDPGIAFGIDEAFATPPEMLSKTGSPSREPWQLPPLALESTIFTVSSEAMESEGQSSLEPPAASSKADSTHSPLASAASSTHQAVTPTPSLPDMQSDPTFGEASNTAEGPISIERPTTPVELDRDLTPMQASPESQIRMRRSLQRTLRDSKDVAGLQSGRSRKGKESISSTGGDSLTTRDSEGISRGTGSFTVHGKKASVITLPPDWQQIPAEERLRSRKFAHSEEVANRRSNTSLRDPTHGSVSDAGTNESSYMGVVEEDATAMSVDDPEAIPTPGVQEAAKKLAGAMEDSSEDESEEEAEDAK